MVTLQQVLDVLNPRKKQILLVAESSLAESQFRAFRTLMLNELGRDGLERDLERLWVAHRNTDGNGLGRPMHAGKEVPHE